MAYDEELAGRVRDRLAGESGLEEKAMFGGLAFLLAGNMAVGVAGEELMVRLGRDAADDMLEQPDVRPFDKTGRRMTGWILVAPGALRSEAALAGWVGRGVEFARGLPAKR